MYGDNFKMPRMRYAVHRIRAASFWARHDAISLSIGSCDCIPPTHRARSRYYEVIISKAQ